METPALRSMTTSISLEALENKLGQFPAGTIFQLRIEGPDRDQVIERLKQFGARKQIAFRLAS